MVKKDLPDGVVPGGINSLRITSVTKSHEGTFICVGQTNSSNFGSGVHIVPLVIYPETCGRVKAKISDASDWYITDPDVQEERHHSRLTVTLPTRKALA